MKNSYHVLRQSFSCCFLCACTFLISSPNSYAQNNPFEYFFRPRPDTEKVVTTGVRWLFKPVVQIPAIKITESTRPEAELDAVLLASAGGGLTLQRTIVKDGKDYASFSISPIVLLLTGNTANDEPLDLSYCFTVGALNNIVQLGIGYDFGVVQGRSRWFLATSFGINLFNN